MHNYGKNRCFPFTKSGKQSLFLPTSAEPTGQVQPPAVGKLIDLARFDSGENNEK